ncbi:hypothetical protein Taro_028499 [Colocasia esculenta]|uniref:BZIP domain-containing protein n=1 Tax=Colocasia esculenta TaxID=4460 RepID=A0A843VQK4_COLES|nr:hypothetical protein [Colocasia esculenta]
MPEERARSPPHGGSGGEGRAEEPAKTVYFVPIYAVAVVDPNKHVGNSRLPIDDQRRWTAGGSENVGSSQGVSPVRGSRGKAAEPEAAAQQKRQKLIVMRKRGRIPEYDDDDPHKPTPKRLRNRMKAQKSRDKKKAYMNSLESKIKDLENMNSELEERCLSLQFENEAMKNEVLESDFGAKEELLHYYEKLQKDKENTLDKSIENHEDIVGKLSENQIGKPEKSSQITDLEDAPETEFDDETIPVTELDDQVHILEKYGEVNDQQDTQQDYVEGSADKFAEVDEQDDGGDPCPSAHYLED